jgi:parvulin-like peptidyl-prolyl isomerase
MFQCKALWLGLIFAALFAAAWKSNEPAQKATPAAKSPRDEVAAVVNGERIMLSELIGRLVELDIKPEQREDIAGNVLDGMIDNMLLTQFLASQRIAYDAKSVDSQIAEVRAEYEKKGVKFGDALARIGLTEQKLRNSVIAESQWQTYVKRSVTDKQLQDYFAKYREFFDGTEVRVSHILVEVAPGADQKTRAAARAKIDRIRKELTSGLSFAEAARKYSDCPSKEQGGDVDFFQRFGKMVEPFAAAAFALKRGETSGVVETEFGYHIIKVTDRKTGTRTKLDNAELRSDLMESLGEQLKNDIVAKARKAAKIELAPGVPPAEQAKTRTATQPSGKVKK